MSQKKKADDMIGYDNTIKSKHCLKSIIQKRKWYCLSRKLSKFQDNTRYEK